MTSCDYLLPSNLILGAGAPMTGASVMRSSDKSVILSLQANYIKVSLPETHEIFVGRAHPSNPIQPDVDLTAYEGLSAGISRFHAAIKCDENGWWLTDLSSSNGTWVNGTRLAPQVPYLLNAINMVQLGNLEIQLIAGLRMNELK